MDKEYALDTAQKITAVIEALKSGMLKIRQVDEAWARELLAAPRGPTGLFDISKLSSHAVGTARATALGLQHFAQQREDAPADAARDPSEAQCQLFHFFSNLFEALTGAPPEVVDSVDEVRDRMLDRVRHDSAAFASSVDSSTSELFDFYRSEASALFNVAKRLGGMKAVLGGQRQFGISALESTRISGLYLDTQLIPDPVYPFLTGNLHLNAAKLQLAHVLYYILALRPLVDARLPEPLIFVFPSFEENLEERDAITQAGIADLLLKLVTPICKAPLANVEELYDYARREEASFLAEAMKNRLFVPPGGSPISLHTSLSDA